MLQKYLLLLCFTAILASSGNAQLRIMFNDSLHKVPAQINGLKKISREELGGEPGKQTSLNIMGVDAYTDENTKIDKNELMTLLMTGDYVISLYIDNDKEVKAILLSEASEEQKNKMKNLQTATGTAGSNTAVVGKKAPGFVVKDIRGTTWSLQELKGKVVVLNFWFKDCVPCVSEMPELNELVKKYKGRDVVFLAPAIDDEATMEKFLTKQTFDYNIIAADTAMQKAFNIAAYPAHVVIDSNGIIQLATIGLSANTVATVAAMVEKLLK